MDEIERKYRTNISRIPGRFDAEPGGIAANQERLAALLAANGYTWQQRTMQQRGELASVSFDLIGPDGKPANFIEAMAACAMRLASDAAIFRYDTPPGEGGQA